MNEGYIGRLQSERVRGNRERAKKMIKDNREGKEICAIKMGNYISLKTAKGPKKPHPINNKIKSERYQTLVIKT